MDEAKRTSDPIHMPPPCAPAPPQAAAATSGATDSEYGGTASHAQYSISSNQHKQQRRRGQKHKEQQQHHKQQHQQQQPNGNGGGSRPRKLKQPRTHEMPRMLAEILHEPKQALLHRVVRIIGPKAAWDLLKETVRVEAQGGQHVNALGSGVPEKFLVHDAASHEKTPRKRTTGGIYFALLKDAVPRETYRAIYEVETKRKKDFKKRVRYERKQRFEGELAQLGFDALGLAAADGAAPASASTGDREDGEVDAMDVA